MMIRKQAIYITIDQHFVGYAIAFINSLAENYPDYPELLIHINDSVSERYKNILKQFDRTVFISNDEEFEKNILNIGQTGTGKFASDVFKLTKF